jgi:predicted nucleic acid-binding protein
VSEAVTNAGPLIHLSEIGQLQLFRIFNDVHVPDEVWQETVGCGRVSEANLQSLGRVRRHTLLPEEVASFTQLHRLEALHEGERQCLCLCLRLGAVLFLTDDLAARAAGRSVSVTPVGSLGIVARAYRLGQITLEEAEQAIGSLYDVSTLFVTRAIVELVLRELQQQPP